MYRILQRFLLAGCALIRPSFSSVAGACTAENVNVVNTKIPNPYWVFGTCSFNPTPDFNCGSIYQEVTRHMYEPSDECIDCFRVFRDTLEEYAADSTYSDIKEDCTGTSALWTQTCISSLGPALVTFKLCSGYDLQTSQFDGTTTTYAPTSTSTTTVVTTTPEVETTFPPIETTSKSAVPCMNVFTSAIVAWILVSFS